MWLYMIWHYIAQRKHHIFTSCTRVLLGFSMLSCRWIWFCYIVVLWMCYFVWFCVWFCYIVVLWICYIVVLWSCVVNVVFPAGTQNRSCADVPIIDDSEALMSCITQVITDAKHHDPLEDDWYLIHMSSQLCKYAYSTLPLLATGVKPHAFLWAWHELSWDMKWGKYD